MKLSEAIDALYQGKKITQVSWGKDYIYWDYGVKILRNGQSEPYNVALSTIMSISRDGRDCWTIAKEEVKFKDVPIGKPCRYGDDIIIRTEPFKNCSKGTTNAFMTKGQFVLHMCYTDIDSDFWVEYPLT